MVKNWAAQQIAEHVVEFYKLTPEEIQKVVAELALLWKKAK